MGFIQLESILRAQCSLSFWKTERNTGLQLKRVDGKGKNSCVPQEDVYRQYLKPRKTKSSTINTFYRLYKNNQVKELKWSPLERRALCLLTHLAGFSGSQARKGRGPDPTDPVHQRGAGHIGRIQ